MRRNRELSTFPDRSISSSYRWAAKLVVAEDLDEEAIAVGPLLHVEITDSATWNGTTGSRKLQMCAASARVSQRVPLHAGRSRTQIETSVPDEHEVNRTAALKAAGVEPAWVTSSVSGWHRSMTREISGPLRATLDPAP